MTFEEAERLTRASTPEWAPMITVALTTGLLRYSHLTPDVRRATVRLLDGCRGDVGEMRSAAEQG